MLFYPLIERGFVKALSCITKGFMAVTLPDGALHGFGDDNALSDMRAELKILDKRALLMLASSGDRGFAQAYKEGYWESEDPGILLTVALSNEHCMEKHIYGAFIPRAVSALAYIFDRNSRKGSARNISAHYDLGNDFYKLWLDETMTYSSAIYAEGDDSLVGGQRRKYDRILSRLQQDSGSLLEIGCGWGGFAARAAEKGDFSAKGITLSKEQFSYVQERQPLGYTPALEDYRVQKGSYDHIVSIEMFEAVGERYWPTYFKKVKDLLAKNGRAVIQTITIDEPYFEKYKRNGDAIRSFIFPGGMLPTKSGFARLAGKQGLRTEDRFSFGGDYARTLDDWRARFDAAAPRLVSMGFDEKFMRMWRFYLSACAAGFRTGRIDVMQTELRHGT